MFELRLLGPVSATLNGAVVPISATRQRALLALLAIATGRAVPLDRLIDDLWGDKPPSSAVNIVQVMISGLRKQLGSDVIRTVGRSYALAEDTIVDASIFRSEVHAGSAARESGDAPTALAWLTRALQRWQGEAFEDIDSIAALGAARTALTELRLSSLEAQASMRIRLGQSTSVVEDLQIQLRRHPFREGLHVQLITALGAAGRQIEALDAYERARKSLVEEFGLDPGPELRAAQQAVLRNERPPDALSQRSSIRLGLRETPGRMIGREDELREVAELISDPGIRLVTILGIGGIGKTRLAQELVLRAQTDATFVSLVDAERDEDVPIAIADALGVQGTGASVIESLGAAMAKHESDLLLVIDNYEHVRDAANVVDQLLLSTPKLSVIVTSRYPLGLDAEQRYPLQPLPVGLDAAASALLIDRVRRINPRFKPDDQSMRDAAVIAQMCDGLPLAIEIAAARTSVLDLTELRALLVEPHAFLRPGVPGKRASVRSAIEWSMDALPGQVVTTLEAATVFRGGFTRTALSSVAVLDPEVAADHLDQLLEVGLIQLFDASGGRRFNLLQVVRDAASEGLSPIRIEELKTRHAGYFRKFLGPQPFARHYPSSRAQLDRIADERANLRAAVRHGFATSTDLAADIVVSLAFAWWLLESNDESRPWLEELLHRPDLSVGRRVDCLICLSRAEGGMGDRPRELLTEAWGRASTISSDAPQLAYLTMARAANYCFDGEVSQAETILVETKALLSAESDPLLSCYFTMLTGIVQLFQGSMDDAVVTLTSAARVADDHGLDNAWLQTSHNLSEALLTAGRDAEAAAAATEVIERAHPDDNYTRATAHANLGVALLNLGDSRGAQRELLTALVENTTGIARDGLESLMRYGAVVARLDPVSARPGFFLGVWSAGLEALGIKPQRAELQTVQRYLAGYRDAQPGSAFYTARHDGIARVASLGPSEALHLSVKEILAAPAGHEQRREGGVTGPRG